MRHLLMTSAFLLLISSAAPSEPTVATEPLKAVAAAADEAVAKGILPSIVIIVFDKQRIIWSHTSGLADLSTGKQATLDTRYRLGSIAKSVTATVVAIAIQQGLVDRDWLSQPMVVDGRTITREDLINMRAGLAQAVCYDGIRGVAVASCQGDFAKRYAVVMAAGPGRHAYSNVGPQLIAEALSAQTSTDFGQLAQELLFAPLGMEHAALADSRTVDSARDYDIELKPYDNNFRILPLAGAGLQASAGDLVRYGRLHLSGQTMDGKQLLSPAMLRLLHSAPGNGFYGYGWGRIGANKATELLISDGQVNGGQAMLLLNPSRGVGVVAAANIAREEVTSLALAAIDAALPGIAAAFERDVEAIQKAKGNAEQRFLPSDAWQGAGAVMVQGRFVPLSGDFAGGKLVYALGGITGTSTESGTDEGYRWWAIPCPALVPACGWKGASAKLYLSRDGGELVGQLQVTALEGQLPYRVRLSVSPQ